MGAAQTSEPHAQPVSQGLDSLQKYLTYLYDTKPDRFKQYFSDLFLSPVSDTGFASRYDLYTRERRDLRHFLTAALYQ